jgi:hypothetical protein
LTKRSSRAVLYVDAGDLKSTVIIQVAHTRLQNFKSTGKTCAQSTGDIASAVAACATKRGIAVMA